MREKFGKKNQNFRLLFPTLKIITRSDFIFEARSNRRLSLSRYSRSRREQSARDCRVIITDNIVIHDGIGDASDLIFASTAVHV